MVGFMVLPTLGQRSVSSFGLHIQTPQGLFEVYFLVPLGLDLSFKRGDRLLIDFNSHT